MSSKRELRDMVIPSVLRQCIEGYMMPEVRLPIMNCHGCLYRQEEWRDGGHCYMFHEKPEGTRCGQFKDNREPTPGQ